MAGVGALPGQQAFHPMLVYHTACCIHSSLVVAVTAAPLHTSLLMPKLSMLNQSSTLSATALRFLAMCAFALDLPVADWPAVLQPRLPRC